VFTFGSLFSGIGGLDLGLERAGWRCCWQVESDPYRRSILARHWPEVPRYDDVREVDFGKLGAVDLIAGGFPCQPVSSAGKRQAQNDERWLWPDFARAIRTLRPCFVLVENVPGLLERGFGDVLADLADCGYDAEWQMLPAVALGAPHLRSRVWVVAYPGEGRRRPKSDVEAGDALVFSEGIAHAVYEECRGACHWGTPPSVVRMVDGYSGGVGRYVAALGDAVVPQVGEFVGRLVLRAASLGLIKSRGGRS